MDGQEYLNQISAKNRPVKVSKSGILASKFFWVILIGVVGLVVILILGAILGSGKGGEKTLSATLYLHLKNTSETIKTYQPDVKSSALRSSSASLQGVLSNTSNELSQYLTEKYSLKDGNIEKEVGKKVVETADSEKEELKNELFEAKINGILDRIYAHKMAYEIKTIMAEESKLDSATKNETLKDLLNTSYTSLENLYDIFNDFSETK